MNHKASDDDAFLNLPTDPTIGTSKNGSGDSGSKDKPNPAAELIRRKVEEAYGSAPNVEFEIAEADKHPIGKKSSAHQRFIKELTASGKSAAEIQSAWRDYYAGLGDEQKHEVWQEFYETLADDASHPAAATYLKDAKIRSASKPKKPKANTHKKQLAQVRPVKNRKKPSRPSGTRSLAFGLGVGVLVIFFVLFGLFNERFIAPLIQPSRSLSNVPLISTSAVGSDPQIIIPKINVEIPVVYGVKTIDEKTVDAALEKGVVHYADTAVPGQDGNVVIVGHSSNNIFNKGRYKFAFVLLKRLEPGDTFYLEKDGKRYTYQVYQKKIVSPNDVSVLGPADKTATVTLITCDPPGTSLRRLVITAEQISPSPKNNVAASKNSLAVSSKTIPSNSPTLWSRFWQLMNR